jgi:RNA polymerase sigma-70 factor (ECF subfamily)
VACVERHGAHVRALVRRLGVADERVDAAVQGVFRALWRAADQSRGRGVDEAAFVTQVARRYVLDHHPERGRQSLRTPDDEGDRALAARGRPRQSSLFGDAGRVARALASLPPDQRTALELAVLRGLPYPRIAFLTGLPTAVVRDAARRGLVRVGELLHSESPPAGDGDRA